MIFIQINPYGKNPTTFKLNKLDFFDKLDLESQDRYNRYRKLVRGLINKTFFEIKELNRNELVGVIIYNSSWNPKQPFFEVDLNPKLMPFIEQLKEHYTKVDLNTVCAFKSKHALTLYKFFCSWTNESKNENKRYLTTKDLKELFGLSKEAYVQNGKFKRYLFERKTIKPAIAEINEKTNILIEFKKNKKVNKAQNYEFTWIHKEKSAISKKTKKYNITRES